jgi:hypothetical protein
MVLGKEAPTDYFPWWPAIVRDVGEVLGIRYSTNSAFDDRAELMRVLIRGIGVGPGDEDAGWRGRRYIFEQSGPSAHA